MADTKLSALTTGTTPTYFYGEEVGASKKYNGFGVFNVKDFGALGNSNSSAGIGHDDTAAIQAAVTACETAAGAGTGTVFGGTVYFPQGYYKITAPIVFNAPSTSYNFCGASLRSSAIVGNFAGFLFDRNPSVNSTGIANFRGLTISNINVSGGAIRLLGTDSSWVEWCDIQAGTFGVQYGGLGQPLSGTFTANTTGGTSTTLVVTGITGVIANGSGDPVPLPVPISGTGVSANTNIVSQVGGYTGGNGTYITDLATTCSSATVSTNPNAPTAASNVVSNCHLGGITPYNVDPALSYTGVGIQMGPNQVVQNCHLTGWSTAIRAYGGGNNITGCQIESNTTGIALGIDGTGATFETVSGTILGCQIESNVTAIWLWFAIDVLISSIVIQGNVNADHNSTYAIRISGAHDCTFVGNIATGQFNTAAVYLDEAAIETARTTFIGCSFGNSSGPSIDKAVGKNWSGVKTISCAGFGDISCTLANLVAILGYYTPSKGEEFIINDASVALGSQTYGGTVTGGGGNFAHVWYDTGTTFRYG